MAPCIAVHFHRDPLQPFSLVKGCLQLVNQPITHSQMFTGELSKHPGATPERGLQRAGCFRGRSRNRLAGRSACSPRAPLPGATLQGEATQHPEHPRRKHGHPKGSRGKQTSLLPISLRRPGSGPLLFTLKPQLPACLDLCAERFCFLRKWVSISSQNTRAACLLAPGAPHTILEHAGWPCTGSGFTGAFPHMWFLRATCWQSLGCANVPQLDRHNLPSRTGLDAIPICYSLRGYSMRALPLPHATT